MGRKVDEWKGRTDETPVPPRVKLRICARQNDCCDECGLPFDVKRKPEFDHRPALVNGGENRESKIVAVCSACHKLRTKADVGEKSVVAKKRSKHLGTWKAKSRPMDGSRLSKFKRKMSGEVVLR